MYSFINLVFNCIIQSLYFIGFLLANIINTKFFLTLYSILYLSTTYREIIIRAAPLSISDLMS